MPHTPIVNPFYQRPSAVRAPLVRLPRAPRTASPVPHLTSLYHDSDPGHYGSRAWPGNCGGNLIRDLLLYFRPASVFDPMSGSGTCRDVCRELDIACWSFDIHDGFDITDARHIARFESGPSRQLFDFVWIHPPYWRQKLYADNDRDLSRAPSLDDFLRRYQLAIEHCRQLLRPGGHLAVLMGDYQDRETGFVPLTWHTKRLAFDSGLQQICTDIIRFSYGASSSRKSYRSSFIPGLHDVCMVFRNPSV